MIKFNKMHGLGNDFVVVQSTQLPHADWVNQLSNRKTGIGFDQWLHITHLSDNHATLVVFNADGSRASQCGNGLRCVGKYMEYSGYFLDRAQVSIDGRVHTVMKKNGQIAVDMHRPASIQNISPGVYRVDVGNPHLIYIKDITWEQMEEASERYQVNVHRLVINNNRLEVLHYERGSGRTLACGSGAVACFAVARLLDAHLHSATVSLPGGLLKVWVDGASWWQSGPSVLIYQGNLVHNLSVDLDRSGL